MLKLIKQLTQIKINYNEEVGYEIKGLMALSRENHKRHKYCTINFCLDKIFVANVSLKEKDECLSVFNCFLSTVFIFASMLSKKWAAS